MREGLVLANSMGINRLIAKSDSTETVEACTGEERWWNESAVFYADCIALSSSIGTVKFKYRPREANQVAHELAKFSFSNALSCNWVYEPPSFLLGSLLNDVTIM
jgi:hypothetical protein